MPTRLVNKITGADRVLPDRLAAMMLADTSTGWTKPTKRRTKKDDAESVTETGD